MEPVRRRESNLSVEPAVRAAGANKTMAQKNNRAAHNWMKVKNALDREQVKATRGIEENRSKILKQRERLQNTSLSLTTTPQQADGDAATEINSTSSSKKIISLADVYAELLSSMKKRESDLMSTRSEPVGQSLERETRSFHMKRVGRKPITFSLQKLQRLNSNLSLKKPDPTDEQQEKETASETLKPPGVFDLNDEERNLGPTLRLAPICLPPITKSVPFKPKVRCFRKEQSTAQNVSSLQSDMDDVRYCRYLRVSSGCRRNSAPPEEVSRMPVKGFSAWKE